MTPISIDVVFFAVGIAVGWVGAVAYLHAVRSGRRVTSVQAREDARWGRAHGIDVKR